jgi:FKBP-type peptidyl-prolyl cis-trans isomerase FkpA
MKTHGPRKYAALLCAGLLAACGARPPDPPAEAAQPAAHSMETLDLQPGSGAAVAAGQGAVVQYTGWLYDAAAPDTKGKKFDSSFDSGQPFRFTVGAGQVIKGWDQGVVGMKVGGRRRLTIPAELAYGDSGAGGVIPPGATLVFDVDLVGIE